MKFLRIQSVSLKNIRCFTDEVINFQNGNNTLLGQNGSGKSTILNAIGVGLYNKKYLNNMNLRLSELISYGELKGSITLDFLTNLGDFRSYVEINAERSNKWIIKKKENGRYKEISTKISESEKKIIEIMSGIDEVAFKNAVSSPQGQIANLLDATKGERKNMINKILGVQRYVTTAENLKKAIQKLQEKIATQQEIVKQLQNVTDDPNKIAAEIAQEKEKMLKLTASVNKLKKEIAAIKTERDKLDKITYLKMQLTKDVEHATKDAEQSQKEMQSSENKLQEYFQQFGNTIQNATTAVKLRDEMQAKIAELDKKIKTLQQKLTNYETNKQQKQKLTNELAELNEALQQKKELQLQQFGQISLAELEKKRDDIDKLLSNLLQERKTLDNNISNRQQLLIEYKNDFARAQKRISEFEKDFEQKFITGYMHRNQVHEDLLITISTDEEAYSTVKESEQQLQQKFTKCETEIGQTKQVLQLLDRTDAHNQKCPTCLRKFADIKIPELQEKHKQDITKLQKDLGQLQKDLHKVQIEVAKFETKITENKKKLTLLDTFLQKENEYTSNKKELMSIQAKIEKAESEIRELQSKLARIGNTRIQELEHEKEAVKGKINAFHDIQKELQQLQGQVNTTTQNLENVKQELATENEKELRTAQKLLDDENTLFQQKKELLAEKILPLFAKMQDTKAKIQNLRTEITEKSKDLHALPNINNEDMEKLDHQREKKAAEQGAQQREIEILRDDKIPNLEEKKQTAEKSEQQMKTAESIIEKYEKGTEKLTYIATVLKRLPDKLLFSISQSVSNLMTQKVHIMLPEHNFDQVIMTSDGELVIHRRGHVVTPNELSGGEKTVVALALRMALAQHVAPLQFMILDEPTNHLDSNRINEFLEIIHQQNLLGNSGQLLLVTHRQEFAKAANNLIQLTNDNMKNDYSEEEEIIY